MLAHTEPGAGSDAGGIVTKAKRTASGWLVNGRKIWISNADSADYLVTACRTEAGSAGSRGVSMLIIPRDTPGITVAKLEKAGHNCMPSYDVGFQDVDIPDDALMGGGRLRLSSSDGDPALRLRRAGGNRCRQGPRVVDIAISRGKGRHQFGQSIGEFQAIQHRIAQMQVRVDQARPMLYNLATMIATGRECRRQAAQTKYVASEMLWDVTDADMRALASAGYSLESDVQRHWRD